MLSSDGHRIYKSHFVFVALAVRVYAEGHWLTSPTRNDPRLTDIYTNVSTGNGDDKALSG